MEVYLEVGAKRSFACVLRWPGWARSGRSPEAALEALDLYAVRYLPVARRTDLPADFDPRSVSFDVVEQVTGTATTDFGAPDVEVTADREPVDSVTAHRLSACVSAAWKELDAAFAAVSADLQKGPRGGGRDRDDMYRHVLAAERSYLRKIGVARDEPAVGDREAIASMRSATLEVLGREWDGEELGLGRGASWSPRYAARRIAWHALDHAWEMQDKDLS